MTPRVLRCTGPCRQWVQVYEACQGARTDLEHQWIDPATYVCGACLERAGEVVPVAVTGGEGSSTLGVD